MQKFSVGEPQIMYKSYKTMPSFLRFIIVHALACILFFIAAVIPGIPISVYGEQITSSEIWSSGYGLKVCFVGLALPMCAILLLKRKSYSRQIYVFVLGLILIGSYDVVENMSLVIFGLIITSSITGYLYASKAVRSVFIP